ncbi:unnamed protein product [Thlaspi arvense]|uniref:Elongation Factor G domain-containing protein n=1 Tax=Thlaspi arvense TaxID=13288 RepID=A0AAU9T9H2_THLAR|nr:unnamed protein product [Thlaspi arvense]
MNDEDRLERNLPSKNTMGLLVSKTSILSSRYRLPPHSINSHTRCCIPPSQAYLAFFVIDDLQMDQSVRILTYPFFSYVQKLLFFLSSRVITFACNNHNNVGDSVEWESLKGVLFSWWYYLDILWCDLRLLPRDIGSFMYAISVFIGIANALIMKIATKYTMTSMSVREPVMSLAVQPVSKDSGGQFSKALNRFQKEDPTFKVRLDPESGLVLSKELRCFSSPLSISYFSL